MINYKRYCYLFLFKFIFILLTRRKVAEALYMEQAITPTCFQRCQNIPVRLQFLFGLLVLGRYD